jgi:hypothetical protein
MQVAWKNVFTKTTVAIHPRQHVELARELHIKVVRKLYDHGRRKPCNKAKRVLVGGHPWDIWTRILFVSFLLVPIVCVYIFHDYCREAMIKHLNEPRFEPFSIWSRVIDLHLNTHSSHEICLDILSMVVSCCVFFWHSAELVWPFVRSQPWVDRSNIICQSRGKMSRAMSIQTFPRYTKW